MVSPNVRILFLSQVFPDDRATVRGTFNLALCQALSAEHQVRVIAPRPWTEALPRWCQGQSGKVTGGLLDQTLLSADYPIYWYLPRLALHRSGRGMLRAARRSLKRMIQEFRPDVVLSYWAHPEGRVGLDLARELGVPAACIIGGSDVLRLPHQNPRRRREIVRVLTESDAILTVSHGLRLACTQLGAPPERVHTIYQGIDRRTFFVRDRVAARRKLHIPAGVTAYLWVGRIVKLKRLDVALEAIARLHHGGQRVKLYVLGDGPQRDEVREYGEALGLVSVVDFVGSVPPANLPEWYSAADATVLCSDSEGLPNVLRESLACGTPFVATDVGSIGEFAPQDASRLVPPGDAAALATALGEILRPEFRIGAGRQRPRTWSDSARETGALLELLRNPPAPPRPIDRNGIAVGVTARGSTAPAVTAAPVAQPASGISVEPADVLASVEALGEEVQQFVAPRAGIPHGEVPRAEASHEARPQAANEEPSVDVMDLLNRRLQKSGGSAPGGSTPGGSTTGGPRS